MKSTTHNKSSKPPIENQTTWTAIETRLGLDLAESARRSKALIRRREIQSAGDLLRLGLVYCQQDWSLQEMGAWGVLQGIGNLSDVAVLQRLRKCASWFEYLVYHCLEQRQQELRQLGQIRLRLQDASVINAPGSTQPEWRLHLKLDVGQCCMMGAEITDAHGGEGFARLPIEADEIVVGDRAYSYFRSIAAVLSQQAHVVTRINWTSLPLFQADGARFALTDWLRQLQAPAEQPVYIQQGEERYSLRVIACPLPPQAAEEARRRARKKAREDKRNITDETLLAAGFILLVTDLSAELWPIARILCLYRVRWQVELQFKMCKSLLHFDALRTHDPQLARTYLFGKLLFLLLLEQLSQQVRLQQPAWFLDPDRPVCHWTLTDLLNQHLRQILVGSLSLARFWACLPALARYFCLSPRRRISQLAWIQAWLEHLSSDVSFFPC
jgi:hypothetical protein